MRCGVSRRADRAAAEHQPRPDAAPPDQPARHQPRALPRHRGRRRERGARIQHRARPGAEILSTFRISTLSTYLQTAAHENHLLIAQQQQLQQLIDAQTIQVSRHRQCIYNIYNISTLSTMQHRVQQQEIEAARHFGRL